MKHKEKCEHKEIIGNNKATSLVGNNVQESILNIIDSQHLNSLNFQIGYKMLKERLDAGKVDGTSQVLMEILRKLGKTPS